MDYYTGIFIHLNIDIYIYEFILIQPFSFVLRVKDYFSSRSLLSTFQEEFPDTDEFNVIVKRFITRRRKKTLLSLPSVYKWIHPDKTFDYLDKDSEKLYYMKFRVVRIKLSEDSYECLITNLPDWEFPPKTLKELYHMRWGIETAFAN